MKQIAKDNLRPMFAECKGEEEKEFQWARRKLGKRAWREDCFGKRVGVGVPIHIPSACWAQQE